MRARFFILLGINILLVVGVLYFTQSWLADREPAPQPVATLSTPEPEGMVEVLTTAIAMEPGTLIKPNHLRWQRWPEDNLSDSFIARDADAEGENALEGEKRVEGAVVRYGLAAGQPLTPGTYVKPGERGFLAAILSPGQRAMSIPVTAASGGAGLILPGDRVDILMTQKIKIENAEGEDEERVASETVMSDIRLIALDQKISGDPEDPEVARTATLEVSAKQAEVLAVVQDLGRLSLSLRSIQADENDRRRGATWDHHASLALSAPGTGRQMNAPVVIRGGEKGKSAAR